MIPNNITEQNVLDAIKDFNINGIRYPLARSKKFDLVFNNQTYPPKYIISLANEYANKVYLSHQDFDTYEAQRLLKSLSPNFVIQDKETDNVADLIKKYKIHIKAGGLEDEVYKWELLAEYKAKLNVYAADLYDNIKSIDFGNLLYFNAKTVLIALAKERQEPYRECLKVLFDENKPLAERIKYYCEQTLQIYRVRR